MDDNSYHAKDVVGLTAKLSIGLPLASPGHSGLSPCQDLGFLFLSQHGLFHLSWLANSTCVFPSIKWSKSAVPTF